MTVTASPILSGTPVARSEAAPGRRHTDGTDAFRTLLDEQSAPAQARTADGSQHGSHASEQGSGKDTVVGRDRSRGEREFAGDRHDRTRGRHTDADAGPAQETPLRDRLPLLASLQHLYSAGQQDQAAATADTGTSTGGDPTRPSAADGLAAANLQTASSLGFAQPVAAQGLSATAAQPIAGPLDMHMKSAGVERAHADAGPDAPTIASRAQRSDKSDPPARQHASSQMATNAAQTAGGMTIQVAASVQARPELSGSLRQRLPSDDTALVAGKPAGEADAADAKSAGLRSVTRGGASLQADRGREPASGEKGADRDAAPARGGERRSDDIARTVTVTASQSFAAPASLPMSQTTASLVAAIGADNGFRQAFANAMLPSTVATSAHLLRIELHPAELGAVTASLRLAGQQLSVEIKPETHEAYRRLTADADEIRKSLDRLGLSVDTVTILQPQIAATAATRTDMASSATAAPGNGQASAQSGGTGGNGDGLGGQQSGRNRNDGGQDSARAAPASRIRSGGDLFI